MAGDPDEIAVVHDPEIESIFPWLSKAGTLREMAAAAAPYAEPYLASITDIEGEVRRLTKLFVDGAGEWAVRVRLQALGPECWPEALLERYGQSTLRDDRFRCVTEAIKFARDGKTVKRLGVLALDDRSYVVRWRAHWLLAYSLDRSLLPTLRKAKARETRPDIQESAQAAITSIEKQNHNLYLDHDETGRIGWSPNPWDAQDPAVQRGSLNYDLGKIREGWETGI